MYTYIYIYLFININRLDIHIYICAYIYACVYIYIHIHTHMFTMLYMLVIDIERLLASDSQFILRMGEGPREFRAQQTRATQELPPC